MQVYPERARKLEVKWQTAPLLNNSFMVRRDLPPDLKKQVQEKLIHLHEQIGGKEILAIMETARFYRAEESTYDVIADFIAEFERGVRAVRQ